ncbi:inositol monophosphatase family protein [Bordetella avium]|uniref:Inositol-1-monophosphatase n=1 Tax=Bordetella avium (strain 197N) TaxID=360910 RepID=Q2KVJ8_BORA1|nr:inositol monophosphatase family protein [Bordetella avium]AZY50218.1 inositol monophosphatase [Bordetella avium]AZY53611.1 inositol monophosphatase [Bordetella avium]RIQ11616.1 inositol monophosphatase [Bordetella avium]RIQ16232.1 inositol monophosphatase [Bordetella avium]RIQ30940.1 inositol monophosphatase [Bordetella avium]
MQSSEPLSHKAMLDLGTAIDIAVTAAHAGAAILQSYAHHRSDLIIDHKARNDLVSQADREAEAAILEVLRERSPAYGIVAEETGGAAQGPATWYIDPLDGTTNFLSGIPHYAVSIALVAHAGTQAAPGAALEEDTPVIGVVYDPNREELFTGVYGVGSWLNGRRIACSRTPSLADSVVATGFPFRDFSFEPEYMPTLDYAIHHSRGVRRMGAAALDLAWVACGRYDGYWEMGLAPWDVAAGTLLVREAGGVCLDMDSRDPWPVAGRVVSGNPVVCAALHDMIRPHLKPRG